MFAPDIYVSDFKGVLAEYARSGNPLWIPEARDLVGNLFWALGHHAAMGWSIFGIDDLSPKSQVAKAYGLLHEMLPQLADWQAAGKVAGVLLLEGEENQVVQMGGYKITINKPRRSGQPTVAVATTSSTTGAAPNPVPLMAGGVSFESRAGTGDTRPFGLVINTAPDEFLFIGSNFSPAFSIDSATGTKVAIGSIDEGRYEKGVWVPGRRLNGDESRPSLGSKTIGILKIRVYQYK